MNIDDNRALDEPIEEMDGATFRRAYERVLQEHASAFAALAAYDDGKWQPEPPLEDDP